MKIGRSGICVACLLLLGAMVISGCGDKTIIIVPGGAGDALAEQAAAYDANARSLVRNAMVTVESANVDIRDLSAIEVADLELIEPSIEWVTGGEITSLEIAANPQGLASTDQDQVAYYSDDPALYACGTQSATGTTFGVIVDKNFDGGNNWFIDGVATDW